MKLIRFGEAGSERPGLQLDDGTRIDASRFGGDYDETFFGGDGLRRLREWSEQNAAAAPRAVRAPVDGQVLKVYARSGERVGANGIAEIAQNDAMYAVAEVYETEIRLVRVGQKARITSPALAEPLTGKVEYIGLKVGKLDVLDTDPAARTDARVVEVKIRLDDDARAAGLTNLQVDVAIQPAG